MEGFLLLELLAKFEELFLTFAFVRTQKSAVHEFKEILEEPRLLKDPGEVGMGETPVFGGFLLDFVNLAARKEVLIE